MDTVHMSDERFGERFPQYKRWLQFRTSEMVRAFRMARVVFGLDIH